MEDLGLDEPLPNTANMKKESSPYYLLYASYHIKLLFKKTGHSYYWSFCINKYDNYSELTVFGGT